MSTSGAANAIFSCYNTGNIILNNPSRFQIGGLCCGKSSIYNSHNAGNITVTNVNNTYGKVIGGLLSDGGGYIENCYNSGDIHIDGIANNGYYIGGITSGGGSVEKSYNKGNIEVIVDKASSTWTYASIGGIAAGQTYGSGSVGGISNSSNEGNIVLNITAPIEVGSSIYSEVGGITGANGGIYRCYNKGAIDVTIPNMKSAVSSAYIGGICGRSYTGSSTSATQSYCYNQGPVSLKCQIAKNTNGYSTDGHAYVGGIVGYGTSVNNSYNSAKIYSELATDNSGSSITSSSVGGIVGDANGQISSSYNTGDVVNKIEATGDVTYAVGGIGGRAANYTNCYNTGVITNDATPQGGDYSSWVGGIGGTSNRGGAYASYNTGNVINTINSSVTDTTASSSYIGGVLGSSGGGPASYCYNTGSITNNNTSTTTVAVLNNYVGGVIGNGFATTAYNEGNITNSIEGYDQVSNNIGGISGYATSSVANCYNKGGIDNTVKANSGTSYTGGIAGNAERGAIYRTYNIGEITNTFDGNISKYVSPIGTTNTGNFNYYLDTLTVPDDASLSVSTASTHEFMTNGEMATILGTEWNDVENDYPTLKIAEQTFDVYVAHDPEVTLTEIELQNTRKMLTIHAEVVPNSSGVRVGGDIRYKYPTTFTAGKTLNASVRYGETSTFDIIALPDNGYRITKITINDEVYEFELANDGSVTIPADYFGIVDKEYNIKVTITPLDEILEINKIDKNGGQGLEGAIFSVREIDERTAPDDSIIGEVTGVGSSSYEDVSSETLERKDLDTVTYGFIQQPDGSYTPKNYNIRKTFARMDYEVDLTGLTGKYRIVVNAETKGNQQNAFIAAMYTEEMSFIERIVYIDQNTPAADYSSQLYDGGNKYILAVFYRTDGSVTGQTYDCCKLNSVRVEQAINYGFIKTDDKYVSTNQGKENTECKSSIPIDLSTYNGKYKIIVNASISSKQEVDSGILSLSGDEYTTQTIATVSGISNNKNYSIVVDGGRAYTLEMEYNRGAGTDSDHGYDTFTINNIKVELDDSDLFKETGLKTNSSGKIILSVPYGKYEVKETKAPDGYALDSESIIHVVGNGTNNTLTFEDTKLSDVTAHYYLEHTGPEFDTAPVKLRSDMSYYGEVGAKYATSPILTIGDYSITRDENNKPEIPSNAIGTFEEEPIEVIYYYAPRQVNFTVHYMYDNVEDESLKEVQSAPIGSVIDAYEDKVKPGYTLYYEQNLPLTVTSEEEDNNIYILYIKDTVEYTVHYFYEGVENEDSVERATALLGTRISNYKDKNITGYEFQKAKALDENGEEQDLPLEIKGDTTKNVINVYYVKANFDYEVHYFYDGNDDESKTDFLQAKYEERISTYADKAIPGYKLQKAKALNENGEEVALPLVIRADTRNNRINVYYIMDDLGYSIHFFYNEVEDTSKVINNNASYGSVITADDIVSYVEENKIDGYKHDRTEVVPLTISDNPESNVINVYYSSIPQGTVSVKYVDNLTGESVSEDTTMTGNIGDGYTASRKAISGYKLDLDNLPNNETGTYENTPQIVTYKYIKLRPYELFVRYSSGEDEHDEAKVAVRFGETFMNQYTVNGQFKVADIELTELGAENYTVYETETPEYCTTVLSEENPAVVELIRRLNTETNKYEFVANYEETPGFNVVIDDENKKVFFDITAQKNEKYDLALRKFITKIDERAITDRIPQVLVSENNEITYVGNDNLEKARNNQMITYTIRMYNESEVRARGKKIVEYVPEGLVFVPDNEINRQYSWKMYKQGANGEAVEVTNAEEATVVVTDFLNGKSINAFNTETKEISYLDVQAVFKVDESKITSQDRIVENKVQIIPNNRDDNRENDIATEKVYVQYFDLSIEKYIEEVKVNINGTETTRKVGYEQKGKLVKVDVKKSKANGTKLTITYGLKIKNVGEIPGYASQITDYIPENFELLNDNNEWTIDGNKAVSTSLSNKVINPGESETINITFEWNLAKGKVGTRRNEAEITQYTNDYDAEDVTKDNKDGEDLLVTLKTGSNEIQGITLIALFATIVAVGTVVVKRKVK